MESPPSPGQDVPASPEPNAPVEVEQRAPAESPSAPAAAGTPTAGSQSAPGPKTRPKKRGGLRERVARDREIERLRNRELLILKLPVALAVLIVLGFVAFLFRVPILRGLAHSDSSVGNWAVNCLGKIRDPGSFSIYVEQLGRGYNTPTFNELVVLGAGRKSFPELDEAGNGTPKSEQEPEPEDPDTVAEHQAILFEAVVGDDADMRRGALYALWSLQARTWTREARLLDGVAKLLDPPCDDVVARRYAALVLKASPAPKTTHDALLHAALGDDDRMVRRHAVEAVGNTLDPRLGPRLLPALADRFPEVRREASLALSRLKADVSLDSLVAIYRSDQPESQAQVLEVIAARSGDDAVPVLLEALLAQAPATRRIAVIGLAKRPGAHVLRGLRDALGDADANVRLEAIMALGAREDAKAVVPNLVGALLRHQGWQEIRALNRALHSLTGADVPAPTPLETSWGPCVDGWVATLDGGDR